MITMPSLKEMRSRIRSVESIKQITKSMEMVAAARLQRALTKAAFSKAFLSALEKILHDLIASTDPKSHPFLTQNEIVKVAEKPSLVAINLEAAVQDDKVMQDFDLESLLMRGDHSQKVKAPPVRSNYGSKNCVNLSSSTAVSRIIVVGADRGLCGAYNSTLFATLDKFLKEVPKEHVELILFGKKAIDYYSKRSWPISQIIPDWGGKISKQSIKTFVEGLIADFLKGKYGSVRIVYTDYRTAMSRQVINEQFLPIEKIQYEQKSIAPYIFEPSEEEVLDEILPRYFIAKAQNMLNQSYVSELSARVFAMRAATKNADEMIEKMTRIRNKVRQAGITKEMLEIATGAEAMK
jgi:F-type H+-transporting ATPase subunit gamma